MELLLTRDELAARTGLSPRSANEVLAANRGTDAVVVVRRPNAAGAMRPVEALRVVLADEADAGDCGGAMAA